MIDDDYIVRCPAYLMPSKVFPNRWGSPHYSTEAGSSKDLIGGRNWTYELTRLPKGSGTSDYNGSYVDNWTLGKLIPGKPSDNRTNCYQYICPPSFNGQDVCWRCGK